MGRRKNNKSKEALSLKFLDDVDLVAGMVIACAGGVFFHVFREKLTIDLGSKDPERFWLGIVDCDVEKPQSNLFLVHWLSTFPVGHESHQKVDFSSPNTLVTPSDFCGVCEEHNGASELLVSNGCETVANDRAWRRGVVGIG